GRAETTDVGSATAGGHAIGDVLVTPGETLIVVVGGAGAAGKTFIGFDPISQSAEGGKGGFNGGGGGQGGGAGNTGGGVGGGRGGGGGSVGGGGGGGGAGRPPRRGGWGGQLRPARVGRACAGRSHRADCQCRRAGRRCVRQGGRRRQSRRWGWDCDRRWCRR